MLLVLGVPVVVDEAFQEDAVGVDDEIVVVDAD